MAFCLFVGIGLVWFSLWCLSVCFFPVSWCTLFSHDKSEYSKNEIVSVFPQVIKGTDIFGFVTKLKNHNIMLISLKNFFFSL